MQFVRAFPRILQAIWEADLVQGPVQVSKLDVTYSHHCVTLWPPQVGAFVYAIPLAPVDEGCIICIYLVLTMVWVYSLKFLCAFSETLTDVTNALVDTDLLIPSYGSISNIPATRPAPTPPTHTNKSLTPIDRYVDDFTSAVQGGADIQH